MRKPLNTVFLMEDLCFGGTQKQNMELAVRLDRARFQPRVITLTGPTDMDEKVLAADIPLTRMGKGRAVVPFFFARLGGFLKSAKPDILVCCTALPNIWGRIWGKWLDVPVVVGTCRGGGAPRRQHERLLWRFCDHVICNSRELAIIMEKKGVPHKHLTFIPNGVDTDFFRKSAGTSEHEGPLILCVARLAADKDHQTLLKAFAIVAAKVETARLRLVGDGPEAKHLEMLVKKLPGHIGRRIEFAGSSANPVSHYGEADIFALSSIREGQPNAVLEAMSCGLPVCATRVGGIPDLLADGDRGLLTPPRDADGLAANILMLLANPDLAARFGSMGRQYVEECFSFRKMVDAHQDVFTRLWESKNVKQGISGAAHE